MGFALHAATPAAWAGILPLRGKARAFTLQSPRRLFSSSGGWAGYRGSGVRTRRTGCRPRPWFAGWRSARGPTAASHSGIGLGALSNLGLCAVLVPAFGLTGAALALAASNGIAFLYRSVTGQMYYRTVASYAKTISGFLLAFAVTAIGTLLWQHFIIKFALIGVILFIYCTLYRAQLAKLWGIGLGILRSIFHRK